MGLDQLKDFNFTNELEKIVKKIKKPNIMICGATGAGKSSVVNHVFSEALAETGEGKPLTKGIVFYESDHFSVNLYDTEGYEIGEVKTSAYKENIITWIEARRGLKMEEQIHEVWYCISVANKRVTDMDHAVITSLKARKVPVAVVLTQIDNVDEKEFEGMKQAVADYCSCPCFATCCSQDEGIEEALEAYLQWDELIAWAVENLDDALKEGFISALYGELDRKRELVHKKIIPIYTAAAGGVAVTPIPFADAVILEPIQISMAIHIMKIYGLDKISEEILAFIGSMVATQTGRFLAESLTTGLLKLIPGVGTAAGIMMNTAVATSITGAIGYAISESCFNYSKAVMQNQDEPLPLEKYFSAEILTNGINQWLKGEAK